MSIESPDRTASRTHTIKPAERSTEAGGWWNGLGPRGRKAFKAAFAGGVFGYVLAIAALRFLPETHGKELVPVE